MIFLRIYSNCSNCIWSHKAITDLLIHHNELLSICWAGAWRPELLTRTPRGCNFNREVLLSHGVSAPALSRAWIFLIASFHVAPTVSRVSTFPVPHINTQMTSEIFWGSANKSGSSNKRCKTSIHKVQNLIPHQNQSSGPCIHPQVCLYSSPIGHEGMPKVDPVRL
jgi:hypothetical protein